MSKPSFTPNWIEEPPKKGSYRSIFKWGAPETYKHPNPRFYALLKEAFQMTDAVLLFKIEVFSFTAHDLFGLVRVSFHK